MALLYPNPSSATKKQEERFDLGPLCLIQRRFKLARRRFGRELILCLGYLSYDSLDEQSFNHFILDTNKSAIANSEDPAAFHLACIKQSSGKEIHFDRQVLKYKMTILYLLHQFVWDIPSEWNG